MSRFYVPLLLLLPACGPTDPLTCYPVAGEVRYRGQPVAEATVVFHAQGNGPPSRPLGITDKDGRFKLTTIRNADGAPVGTYRVTVELRQPVWRGEDTIREGRHLLPLRYSSPTSTPLQVTVQPGNNDVGVLELSDR